MPFRWDAARNISLWPEGRVFFQESTGIGQFLGTRLRPLTGVLESRVRSWNENTYHSPRLFRTGGAGCFCYPAVSNSTSSSLRRDV
jgi:hypothetical protein